MGKAAALIGCALIAILGMSLPGLDAFAGDENNQAEDLRGRADRDANVDSFYASYNDTAEAVALFKGRYGGCAEYARVALGEQDVIVLRWPVGSRVGLNQYVLIYSDRRSRACRILAVMASMAGEFKFSKKRGRLEMVGSHGVVLGFPLTNSGELALTEY